MKTQAKIAKKPAQQAKAKPGPARGQARAVGADRRGNAQMGAAPDLQKETAIQSKSTICLTFDDGPVSRVTESVIAVLASEDVPATFFLNAVQSGEANTASEGQQRAFREIIANPLFQAGSHGYSHDVAARPEYAERYAGIDPYKKDKRGKYLKDGKGNRIVDWSKVPKDDKLSFARDAERTKFRNFLDENNKHFLEIAKNAANLKDTTSEQRTALKGWRGFKLVRLPGDGRFLVNLKNEINAANLKHVGWQFEIASGPLMRKHPRVGAKLDWLVKGVDAEPDPRYSRIVKGNVLPDGGAVVLLHDRHWNDTTKLRNIIQRLKKEGFAFGALDEAGSCIDGSNNKSKSPSVGTPAQPAPEPSTNVLPSLELGRVNDPAEHEADAVANRVMLMRDGGACCSACVAGGPCASHAGEIERGQAMPIRRKVSGVGNSAGLPVPAGLEPQVRRATSGGEALPATVRAFFEPRFGQDLSDVRIHRDADAAESARGLGARAYTVGSHIAFSAGRWAPGTDAGDRLIAHELAHATANGDGPIRRVVDDDDGTCLRGVMTPTAAGRKAHTEIQAVAQVMGIRTSPMEASNGKVAAPRADLFGLWNEDQARQKGLPATRTPGNDTPWVIAEIGEIKPVSYANGEIRHGLAMAQVQSYWKQWERFSNVPAVPMKSMPPFSLPDFAGTHLTCGLDADPDKGLYIYRCSKPGDPERAAAPANVPIAVSKKAERELRELPDIDKLPGMTPVQVRERLASAAPALLNFVQELVIGIGIALATAAVIALIVSTIPAAAAGAIAAMLIAAVSVNALS